MKKTMVPPPQWSDTDIINDQKVKGNQRGHSPDPMNDITADALIAGIQTILYLITHLVIGYNYKMARFSV